MVLVKYLDNNGEVKYIGLKDYCEKISGRNNHVLYKIESYLNKKMSSNDDLKEIRKIILDVSADVSRISENIIINEEGREAQ